MLKLVVIAGMTGMILLDLKSSDSRVSSVTINLSMYCEVTEYMQARTSPSIRSLVSPITKSPVLRESWVSDQLVNQLIFS